jgi:hypothetical protein
MKKANILGILASTAMLGMPTRLPESRRRNYPLQGNQGWGHYHEPKVKKWRAKERRAKQARKINWN